MDTKEKIFAGLIRRCLTNRYVLRSKNQEAFVNLIRFEAKLSEHFRQLGVRLVLNETLGIAYLEPIEEFDEEIGCQLGRRRRLTPLESVALVKLRSKRMEFFSGSIDSETPTIVRQELRDFLREFLPEIEERKFETQFNSVLKSLVEHRVLHETDSERFEISPVCDVLLSGDQIRALLDRAKAYFQIDDMQSASAATGMEASV